MDKSNMNNILKKVKQRVHTYLIIKMVKLPGSGIIITATKPVSGPGIMTLVKNPGKRILKMAN
jgi:hypothetical protein